MATLEQLHEGLIRADAAGNAEDAKAFADAIRAAQDAKGPNPTAGMSWGELAAAGAGKAVSDTGLGLRQLGGGVMDYLRPRGAGQPSRSAELRKEYEEVKRRDAPLMDTAAGMIGNVGGNIATALLPGGAGIATGRALSRVPAAARMAQALMTGGRAMVAPTSIPGAAALGMAQGAVQPAADAQDRLTNMAIGGGASAAVPTAIRAGQIGKAFIDPLTEAGQKQIIGRAMNSAAGGDSVAALQNLRNAQPLVPGSMPTVGQAAQNPGLAALERTAVPTDPVAMNEMAKRLTAQNDARINAVQTIAGTPAAREAAEGARSDAANVAYTRARTSDAMRRDLAAQQQANIDAQNYGLTLGSGLPQRTAVESAEAAIRPSAALEDLAKRPDFKGYIAAAQRLAANKGQEIGNPLESIDGLHYIKLAIDDALSGANPTQALGRNAKAATMDMKDRLTTEMDKISPAYAASREAFQQASRPINQMGIANQIIAPANQGGAVSFRGELTPAAFARMLRDKTAQDVTGFKGATLANTMEPEQLATLNAVKDDLLRADFAQTAGKGGGSDTVQKLAFSNLMANAGLPSAVQAFGARTGLGGLAQKAGQVIYRDANQDMSRQLAQALLDPTQASALMEAGMVNPQLRLLLENARRGGSGIGALTPALLNSAIPRVDVSLDLGQK